MGSAEGGEPVLGLRMVAKCAKYGLQRSSKSASGGQVAACLDVWEMPAFTAGCLLVKPNDTQWPV